MVNSITSTKDYVRVLDIGSGFGHLSILIKRIFGYDVYALDHYEFWRERFRDEGIPCLDLRPVFEEGRRERVLEYPHDRHWNAAGHRLAAQHLLDFLAEHSLFP